MTKLKTGDLLCCEVCGLTLVVDEECGCVFADVLCCDEPMINKGPAPPKKKAAAAAPKKKTAVKAAKKPEANMKVAVKKPAKKKVAAGKPAAGKKAAKKK